MNNRILRSRLLKTLALSLVAAAAVQMPHFAGQAQAGTMIGSLNLGDIIKLKTTWGGGYALNVGQTAGSHNVNEIAQIHGNSGWDDPNRWLVGSMPVPLYGLNWVLLRNKFSEKCLAVEQLSNLSYVSQQDCNASDSKQLFAREPMAFGQTAPRFRNLAHREIGLNTVLTQVNAQVVGTLIRMEFPSASVPDSVTRQEWRPESCLVNGVEQQHC